MSRKKSGKKTKAPAPRQKRSFAVPVLCLGLLGLLAAAVFWFSRPKMIELPYLTTRNVAVMDLDTGRLVAETDSDAPHSPSSLTKMMSILLVLDDIENGALSWDDVYTVTEAEAYTFGSKYGMEPGEVFTVRELVAGAIMVSGCDCIQCLVRLCAPDETAFVERMNEKARELKLKGSHFANPTGIDAAEHYMTARDLASLARTLVTEYPEILDFTSVPSLTIGERTFQNIHRLVGKDDRVKGLKTGTTQIGGFNLCTYAEKDGCRYIVVLLDSTSDVTRFSETVTILDLLLGDG